jgi:hypothetical protein
MTRFNAIALAGVVSHQPGHCDVKHAMTDSCCFRILPSSVNFTRECLALAVDTSLLGAGRASSMP